jgi:polyphosphate kinase
MKRKKIPTINRDVSWMYFNRRLLDEAANNEIPLLERLNFLGIYSNNLDEFFQVRVATLMRLLEFEENERAYDSDNKKTVNKILKLNEEYSEFFEQVFLELMQELEQEHIFIVDENHLNEEQIKFLNNFYYEKLMNTLYPILVTNKPEDLDLNDKSIYLAVKAGMIDSAVKTRKEYAIVEIPSSEFGRFIVLPKEGEKTCIIFLDDVIRFCLPKIFAPLNCETFQAYNIKFTRDAEMDIDNSSSASVLDKVSSGIKSRKSGLPVRFVYDREIPSDMLRFFQKILKIDKNDARIAGAKYHNLKDFMQFPKLPDYKHLKYPAQPPVAISTFDNSKSLLHLIRENDQYLHFPYHNFDNFIRLLRESAINPEVKAIKVCIYRAAKDSKVIKALVCAAMNGKKVTANVELLARFDESSNIKWAKKMQEAGIKVIFGLEGLKVHSKLVHITARNGNVACIGTGNFHEGTAHVYTDVTLLTARKTIVEEVENVFDFLEHPYRIPEFKHLMVSPINLRKRIIGLINTEILNAKKGLPAYIHCKLNHIVDEKIIHKLYDASNAGVEVKLMVRGCCSIMTGKRNYSTNISITGIIDRYLEHSRVLIFGNGGDPKYYIGSADWMMRNLDTRVEVYTPIYDKDIQNELRLTLDYGLRDNVKGRIVDGSGKNLIQGEEGVEPFCSQVALYQHYINLDY